MTCASCVNRVEKALRERARRDRGQCQSRHRAGVGPLSRRHGYGGRLNAAVEQTGYGAKLRQDSTVTDHERATREAEIAGLRHALLLAAILTAARLRPRNGLAFRAGLSRLGDGHARAPDELVSQFVLTTLVLFGPGLRFFRKGIPALLRAAPDMNSLVVLGTSAAYAYSVVATFCPACCPPARPTSITRPPPSS